MLNLDCVPGRRRKIRCQFASSTTETCIGCESRGTSCVTQDQEDLGAQQHAVNKHREAEERIRRAEGLLEKMIEAASRITPTTEAATPGSRSRRSVVERGSEPPRTRTRAVPESDGQWPTRPMSPSASPTVGSCPSIQVFDSTLVRLAFQISYICIADGITRLMEPNLHPSNVAPITCQHRILDIASSVTNSTLRSHPSKMPT